MRGKDLVVVAFFALASQVADRQTAAAQTAAADSAAAVRLISAAEQRLDDAMLRGDTAIMNELLASDYRYAGPGGRLDGKAVGLAAYGSGAIHIQEPFFTDRDIRVLGPMAVVTQVWHARVGPTEAARFDSLRFTRVWTRRDGSWRVMFSQSSPFQTARPAPNASSSPARENADATAERELRAILQELSAAVLTHDASVVAKYYSPDYVMTFRDGRRDGFENSLRVLTDTTRNEWHVHELSDEAFHFYGETAIATFSVHSQWIARVSKKPFDVREQVTQTWVRRDGRWTVVATQVTAADTTRR
jgi:uncharacterized protein (TIGR02246 family)